MYFLGTPSYIAGLKPHNTQPCPASFNLSFLSIGNFYNDPITRISLITSITAAFFSILLHLQASLQHSVRLSFPSQSDVTLTYDQALTKRVLMLPVAFLALSALASLFSLLAWPTWRLLG